MEGGWRPLLHSFLPPSLTNISPFFAKVDEKDVLDADVSVEQLAALMKGPDDMETLERYFLAARNRKSTLSHFEEEDPSSTLMGPSQTTLKKLSELLRILRPLVYGIYNFQLIFFQNLQSISFFNSVAVIVDEKKEDCGMA